MLEGALRGPGHRKSKGGLTSARRTPKDRRAESILLDQSAQRTARADEMFLADHFVEGLRTKPRGQRRLLAQTVGRGRAEQIVAHSELNTNS